MLNSQEVDNMKRIIEYLVEGYNRKSIDHIYFLVIKNSILDIIKQPVNHWNFNKGHIEMLENPTNFSNK